ncbi:Microcystin-dependent protein [Paenibacillus algorifonticola]|uniref:Microcystin-dependent protein n=1 Tax=Paenibacillus algorifonticola TaxID=684063 RepID=A0A1I2F5M4_9BACL|nr:tail fiber protein [Paenibacillus algorifonticola]SFF00475.1 Microcystin-dependent protein [Paenibacillus algorifonticola]
MDAFTGEIRIFTGNYPPYKWALCNGAILPIQSNTVLFSIIGTQYGGNGTTTFALPNLMGMAPMGQGAGPGLTSRTVGEQDGEGTVTLQANEIPAHTHIATGIAAEQNSDDPANNYWAQTKASGRPSIQRPLYKAANNTQMNPLALTPTGGNHPHNNMQPYLAMNFIICLDGEYPPRG